MPRNIEGENGEEFVQITSEFYEETFRYALKPVIIVCQFFGLFPLNGLMTRDLRKLHFKWKSPRILLTAIYASTVLMFAIASMYKHFYKGNLTIENLNGAIFYFTSALSCAFFLKIDWRQFIIEWTRVEAIFFTEQYKQPPQEMSLKRKVHICFFIGLATFALNQIFFASSELTKTIHLMRVCNRTKHDVIEDYVVYHLDHIFNFIPYNHAFGAIGEFFNFVMSFYWTFPDIFIMLLSIGISYRFQQINKRVEYFKHRIISNERWNEVRLHYTEVCELVMLVDKTFDKLILLATMNNTYLLLVQTLHILAWQPFVMNKVFHIYSVVLLIGKTVAMFLVSSTIHENSEQPIKVLRTIPCEGWTDEAERFLDQVLNETTALSGMGFFLITKGMFFGLCGAVFTLQLILYEYNKVDVEHSSWYTCNI